MVKSLSYYILLMFFSSMLPQCGKDEKTRVVYKYLEECEGENCPTKEKTPKKEPVPTPKPAEPRPPVKHTTTIENPTPTPIAPQTTEKKVAKITEDIKPKWTLKGVNTGSKWSAEIDKVSHYWAVVTVTADRTLEDSDLVKDYRLGISLATEGSKFYPNPKITNYNAYYAKKTYTYDRNIQEIFFIRYADTEECELRVVIDGWFSDSEEILQGKCRL